MKSLAFILLLITSTLHAQNNIPEEMAGTWQLNLPGEAEIPSQIFKWVFYTNESGNDIAEFHWLFKRIEDKDYITVFVVKGNLLVAQNVFTLSTFSTGSQQVDGKLEFYEEIKWFSEGNPKFDRYPKKERDFDDKDESTIYTKIN